MLVKIKLVSLAVVAVLVTATLLRLAPVLYFNEPYSVDSWPLIRDSNILMTNPNIKIWNDSILDGYNNRWPGTILATLLYSIITGLSVIDTYKFFGPLISSLTALILMYAILRRIYKSSAASVHALTYFALALPLLVFTSATIKEVYAYPIFYSIALLTLITISRWGINAPAIVITTLLATAISMTHHLASIMLIGILVSTHTIYLLLRLLGRLTNPGINYSNLLIPLAILSTVFATYYFMYGIEGFKIPLSLDDVITYLVYAATIYLTYALTRLISSRTRKLMSILAILVVLITLLILPRKSPLPGIGPINDPSIIIYILPPLLPIFIIKLSGASNHVGVFITGLYLLLATNIAYVVLAKPELSGVFHRIANYLIIANTLLIANSLLSKNFRVKAYILTLLLITITCSIVGTLNRIQGGDGVTYYWTFRPSEVSAFSTISNLIEESITITGDAKVAYFYSIQHNVDSGAFLKFIQQGSMNALRNKLVLLYSDNYRWGYVVSLNSISIKPYRSIILKLDRLVDFGYVNGLMSGE